VLLEPSHSLSKGVFECFLDLGQLSIRTSSETVAGALSEEAETRGQTKPRYVVERLTLVVLELVSKSAFFVFGTLSEDFFGFLAFGGGEREVIYMKLYD
jgi:hypothetical protein